MLSIENETSFNPPIDDFNRILQALQVENEVELTFVNSEVIKYINKEHRNIDKETDVLSFPIAPFPHAPLGSIVISTKAIVDEAKNHNHSEDALHGLLHLLGYDHEVDSGQMREIEARIVKELGLPPSLIVRTEKD